MILYKCYQDKKNLIGLTQDLAFKSRKYQQRPLYLNMLPHDQNNNNKVMTVTNMYLTFVNITF